MFILAVPQEIPFIGNLSFKVYSDMDMASITGLQQKIAEKGEKELAEEFIQVRIPLLQLINCLTPTLAPLTSTTHSNTSTTH